MVQLILLDVDGTLVGRSGSVHPAALIALAEARERGVHLGVCTGRPAMGAAVDLARAIAPGGYHVFFNGAAVVRLDGAPDGPLNAMEPASVERLVVAAREAGLTLELYSRDSVYVERDDPNQRRHVELIEIASTRRDLLAVREPVLKAQWVVPLEAMPAVEALTNAVPGVEMGTGAHAEMPGVMFASVTRQGVSKLAAARWIAEQVGTTLAHTAMVGDGDGDAELIAHAGVGVAMGNASERARGAARYVVGDVDAGGLAEAVRIALG